MKKFRWRDTDTAFFGSEMKYKIHKLVEKARGGSTDRNAEENNFYMTT